VSREIAYPAAGIEDRRPFFSGIAVA
jgi:hypothetical protein